MKKDLLIIMPSALELGGIERSLIGLLDSLDYEKVNVDLFLYGHHGELFNQINTRVNLLPEYNELAYLRESLQEKIRHKAYLSVFMRCLDLVLSPVRKKNNDRTWARIMNLCVRPIDKQYDLAICFFMPFDMLATKVRAKKKVGWIHTDYGAVHADKNQLRSQYKKTDFQIAVSDAVRDSFCAVLPEFEKTTKVIENILPADLIRQMAEEKTEDKLNDSGIRLLSVGRFSYAKNFDNIPDICRRMLEQGLDIYWYIIGFGPDDQLIRKKIIENGVAGRIIILGKKENPYPYMKACDIYVQPSRYEGKCVAVREAQILAKPVIITSYATAASQVNDGVDGIIVPLENAQCANGLMRVIHNSDLRKRLEDYCKTADFSNRDETEKIYDLM